LVQKASRCHSTPVLFRDNSLLQAKAQVELHLVTWLDSPRTLLDRLGCRRLVRIVDRRSSALRRSVSAIT